MGNFFNAQNGIFRIFGKITDILWVSFLWVICCIPIITIGPATTALYHTSYKCIRRNQQGSLAADFFGVFKSNFKVSTISGIIAEVILVVTYIGSDAFVHNFNGQNIGVIGAYAFFILFVFFVGVFCYMFPVLSRFSFEVGGLFAISLKLAIRHILSTIILLIFVAGSVAMIIMYWIPAFFMPALCALASSFVLEPIFNKYTPTPQEVEVIQDENQDIWDELDNASNS